MGGECSKLRNAGLVDADIEQQQVEDDRERDEDEVIRANFERMRERDSGGSGSERRTP